jgi:replicative DNA helicase
VSIVDAGSDTSTVAALALLGLPQAEAAVLGAAMFAPRDAAGILGDLTADDFTDPRHVFVLAAIRRLIDAGQLPDPVMVLGELRRTGVLPSTADRGPGNLLHDLMAACPVPAQAAHYRRLVLEHSFRRRALKTGDRLVQHARGASLVDLRRLIATELAAVAAAGARCGGGGGARTGVAA